MQLRADVNFARYLPAVEALQARMRYEMVPLESIASVVQYGDSSKSIEEDNGAPILRMNNLRDGDWDLSDLKYTSLSESERSKYELDEGDMLFNRTNSKELVGKCAVFREAGRWYFAGYLIRVRVKDPRDYNPEFLARFLNSDVGRVQIDRLSRQIIGMANVNAEEIKSLLVPKPPRRVQEQMVKRLAKEWKARSEALSQSADLLETGNREVASRLALHPPIVETPIAFASTREGMILGDRLNPDFFHPERIESIRAIEASGSTAKRLTDLAEFARETVPAPQSGEFYIGLANAEKDTGELIFNPEEELPEGDCVRFQPGDVLYSKLRPYLNKVLLAEQGGVASPEFFVLRARAGVRAAYLAAILRSPIVLAQTRHMISGNTHPRLTKQDVENMYLPLPALSVQDAVAKVEGKARRKARALRHKSDRTWSAAKKKFGDDLINPGEI